MIGNLKGSNEFCEVVKMQNNYFQLVKAVGVRVRPNFGLVLIDTF